MAPKKPFSYADAAKNKLTQRPRNVQPTESPRSSSTSVPIRQAAASRTSATSQDNSSAPSTALPTSRASLSAPGTPRQEPSSATENTPTITTPETRPESKEKTADEESSSTAKASASRERSNRPTFFDATYAANKGFGSNGEEILKVRVNRFKIIPEKLPRTIYFYSVALPRVSGRTVKNATVKRQMFTAILHRPNQPWAAAFQAHTLFTDWNGTFLTTKPLHSPEGESGPMIAPFDWKNQTEDEPREYTAAISHVNNLSLHDLHNYCEGRTDFDFSFEEYMRAFNMMVRTFAAQHAIIIGKNRVFDKDPGRRLSSPLCARTGIYNSVRPGRSGLYLQMNTSSAAFFPKQNLVDFIEAFDPAFATNPDQSAAKALIRQLQVIYRYIPPKHHEDTAQRATMIRPSDVYEQGKRKQINALRGPADFERFHHNLFPSQNGLTVLEYFNNFVLPLTARLQRPDLPVVNVGSRDRNVLIPLELLQIAENQAIRGPVPDKDMGAMGNFSQKKPQDNVAFIERHGHRLLESNALRQNTILDINEHMHDLTGRMLVAPTIQYRTRVSTQGSRSQARSRSDGPIQFSTAKEIGNGKWNLKDKRFFLEGSDAGLMVIHFEERIQPHVLNDLRNLPNALKDYGLNVNMGRQDIQRAASSHKPHLDNAFARFTKASSPVAKTPVVIVILPTNNIDDYARVKRWGDLFKGVHTICLLRRNLANLSNPAFQGNLATKFNVKLGGNNHILVPDAIKDLHTERGTTMVVGADVTHPGLGSVDLCPSIAAVVASTSRDCFQFPGSMRLQEGRREDIVDLKDMMIERLQVWQDRNNSSLPDKILFYRDGVSENQFAIVKLNELRQIKAACQEMGRRKNELNYNPRVTLVICTKRHQTRFYRPIDKSKQAQYFDHNGNFKPGLVVDDESVRLPNYFDFFLQAHTPILGTGRPCHYFVLENEIGFTPDQLQQVTFNLSWIYATALTPVSLVAPAYYADRLCERGRCYMRPVLVPNHAHRREALDVIDAALQGLDPNATVQEKRTAVARHFSNSMFWNIAGGNARNPCNDALKDTMFYI